MTAEKHPQNGCCICEEIGNHRFPEHLRGIYGLADRTCAETSDFIAFPTVSPLVKGHMLIFTKHHVPSLRKTSRKSIQSLQELATQIAARVSPEADHVFFFEHGVMADGKGSCGITHAHLHVLPLDPATIASVIQETSTVFPPQHFGSLSSLLHSDLNDESPYLLFGQNISELKLSFATTIPSQFMRRIIATKLGLGDWDWKKLTGINRFRATHSTFLQDSAGIR
ncbi:hypothetical protein BH09VER1_BH09VER1_17600 [soil metagenome]